MDAVTFAAERRALFVRVDEELLDSVKSALQSYSAGSADPWSELIDDASVLWSEVFESEAPNADPERFLARFREMLGEALPQTEKPEGAPTDTQINRVAIWLGTATVNDATWSGSGARGVRFKAWRTMEDADVRETHRAADGQIASIGGTFDVGGFSLHYPGEPVGPPSIWINCRCIAQPASREGEVMSSTTFALTDEVEIDDIDDDDMPTDELDEDEEEITEIPVHGVLAPEGVMSGDRRLIREGGISWRELPIPLRYETVGSHGGDTSHVVTVGRVDEIWREGNIIRYKGAVVTNRSASHEVLNGMIDGTIRGVSLDGDAAELEEQQEFAIEGEEGATVFKTLRTAGLTIVPIPAFQEAYIGLGHEFPEDLTQEQMVASLQALADCGCDEPEDDEEENPFLGYDIVDLSDNPAENARARQEAVVASGIGFAPGTKDGPGWITHPIPTQRLRNYWVRGKGAAKIKWGLPGDFNRCRRQLAKYVQNPEWLAGMCANMHKEAIKVWPGREKGIGHSSKTMVASASVRLVKDEDLVVPAKYFTHHGRKENIGVVIEGEHIFGYIAHWGVCHIGMDGVCMEAPPSYSHYSLFRTGIVLTDDGESVPVGQITMDTGHANVNLRSAAAVSHYDNTGMVVADVTCGEDELGIWFSGMLREGVSAVKKRALMAGGRLSGDWRDFRGTLELVAALAVNVPGFPVPNVLAASGAKGQTALVAAGVIPASEVVAPSENPTAPAVTSLEEVAAIARLAVREYVYLQSKTERLAPLRVAARQKQIAALRAKMKGN